MEKLKDLIKSKTQHLIWEFEESKVDDKYYRLISKANLGTLTVSWERYVHEDDQTDLVATIIINRICDKFLLAIRQNVT